MRLAIADWDKPGHWKVLRPDGELIHIGRDEFLDWDWAAEGVDALVVESAHLKERNPFSVAQVYFEEELNAWEPGVPVHLFSAKVTKKARGQFDVEDKDKDTEAIASYLGAMSNPMAALKRFSPPAADSSRNGWDKRNLIRREACMQYNLFRTEKHGLGVKDLYDLPVVGRCAGLLDSVFDGLSADVLDTFAVRRSRNGMRFDITPVMSAYCCAFDKDGAARDVGSTYIVKDVIGLHCFGVPNLIRANFMHFKIGPADASERARITRATRQLISALKLAATKGHVPHGTKKDVAAAGATKVDVADSATSPHVAPPSSLVTSLDVAQRNQSSCRQEGLLAKLDVAQRDQPTCQEAAL